MRLLPCTLALLLLVGGVSGEEPAYRAIDSKEFGKLRKALPAYLWLKDARRRKRSKVDAVWRERGWDRVKLTEKQLREVARVLRSGSPYTTEKRRSGTLRVATGEGDEELPVRFAVTGKYKPGRGGSFPLIITCHGGPIGDVRTAESASGQQLGIWSPFVSTIDCIVAAPALTGQSYRKREWAFLKNLIDELDRRYNVDRDRVLLTGHSWGGIVTWHIGPPHADTFCLLAPFVCAVNPGWAHLMNCRALPIYHVQGKRDIKWILETGRERRKVLDELGYEHFYRELPGGHEQFGSEAAKIAKLLSGRRRALYAKEIVRRPGRGGANESDTWYWIRAADRTLRATCDAESNTIEVDVVGAFEVFLSDEMLDLDAPITIRRGDEVVWRGRVERRLSFTLAHIRGTGDRGRIFAASVKVD